MRIREICAVLVFCLVATCLGQQCRWTDTDTRDEYDLSPLRDEVADYFIKKDTYDNQHWDIWINVCRPTIVQLCGPGVAACQQWDQHSSGGRASLGVAADGVLHKAEKPGRHGYGLKALYTGGTEGRKMSIDFLCDYSTDRGGPEFFGENPTKEYNFTWKTKYACPTNTALSAGTILCIIMGSIMFVYFIGGILFNRLRGAPGYIPHQDFWQRLPYLVKDGFLYFFC